MIRTTTAANGLRCALFGLVLTAISAFAALPCSAQSIDLARKITLSEKTLTRRQAMQEIKTQTGYKIIFNAQTLDEQAEVNFGRTESPLSPLLDKLLAETDQIYTIDYDIIVIHRGNKADEAKVGVAATRRVSGTVNDAAGLPLSDVTLEFLDAQGVKTTTAANGYFSVENIPAGNHVVKLTTADKNTIRYREITVPTGQNAVVTLSMGEIQNLSDDAPGASNVIGIIKPTAYYVPTVLDGPSFTGQPKNMFVVSADELDENYQPKAAVKTNLLYLATTTLNVGAEFALARRWTLDIVVGLNPWDLSSGKGGIRHGLIQPEVRYWFCNRFERHFVGLHGIYGQYQIQNIDLDPVGNDLTGKRYDGWGAGAGVSYGYHLPMGKRWAWEFTVGAGYIYLDYDKYNCGECDKALGRKTKHYFGPTKAGINLVYMIK